MIHPADERIVVCVEPAVKKKKHGTMSLHGKCTLEDDVTARNLHISNGPLHGKCTLENDVTARNLNTPKGLRKKSGQDVLPAILSL